MSEILNVPYESIAVGDSASLSKVVTDEDVRTFAEVSLDRNPLHLDEAFAETTMFKQRIAHGMLSAGLISAVIGTQLPGINTIYMGQNLKFVAPVYLGDEITATVEVTEKRDDKHIITLSTTVTNQDGQAVVKGDAVVMKK